MTKEAWRKQMHFKSGISGARWRYGMKSKTVAQMNILDAEINCARAKARAHMAAAIIVKGRS